MNNFSNELIKCLESGEEEAQIQKQMFTRTKELEHIIKFQRETIQDQAMRIEVKMFKSTSCLIGFYEFCVLMCSLVK